MSLLNTELDKLFDAARQRKDYSIVGRRFEIVTQYSEDSADVNAYLLRDAYRGDYSKSRKSLVRLLKHIGRRWAIHDRR